ncbi:hypothetical protein PAXRUDRAFT_20052 [Paxillus rubicundulus Ve08.2h10]|uniref:Uncharacterized protein n=1 Tax=Paxillus rubicundulus Ve08.2h10 TaxID=930991 RepID=A0A0D0D2T8_9AGAM|nr:hypothetical protein PAXRUDRAFT_20052 [Paxillus rubicundulus Ve08.2h10]
MFLFHAFNGAIAAVSSAAGLEDHGEIRKRSIGRIMLEGEVAASVQLVDEMSKAQDATHTAPNWAHYSPSFSQAAHWLANFPATTAPGQAYHAYTPNVPPAPMYDHTFQVTFQYPYHSTRSSEPSSIHSVPPLINITPTVVNEPQPAGAGQKRKAPAAGASTATASDPEPNPRKCRKVAATLVDHPSNNPPESSHVFGIGPCGQSSDSPSSESEPARYGSLLHSTASDVGSHVVAIGKTLYSTAVGERASPY